MFCSCSNKLWISLAFTIFVALAGNCLAGKGGKKGGGGSDGGSGETPTAPVQYEVFWLGEMIPSDMANVNGSIFLVDSYGGTGYVWTESNGQQTADMLLGSALPSGAHVTLIRGVNDTGSFWGAMSLADNSVSQFIYDATFDKLILISSVYPIEVFENGSIVWAIATTDGLYDRSGYDYFFDGAGLDRDFSIPFDLGSLGLQFYFPDPQESNISPSFNEHGLAVGTYYTNESLWLGAFRIQAGLMDVESFWRDSEGIVDAVATNSSGSFVGRGLGGGYRYNAATGDFELLGEGRPDDINSAGDVVGWRDARTGFLFLEGNGYFALDDVVSPSESSWFDSSRFNQAVPNLVSTPGATGFPAVAGELQVKNRRSYSYEGFLLKPLPPQ